MRRQGAPVVFTVLLLAIPLARADGWMGLVDRVSDGDTLWVSRVDDPGRRVKLRLADVDAPESCQPGGPEATQALRVHVLGREVKVRPLGRDTYRRVLARVEVEGQDLGAWLVRQGHAWSVAKDGRRGGAYLKEEREARASRLGLHGQPDPMRPAVFRRWHGPC